MQVLGEQQQAGGHARHDLVRVALQVRHRAGLPHLLLEQPRALLLAVERDEEAGQGQEQEGGRRAGQPPRALELGERLVAVHLEHERPAGGRDPAHRGQHRHAAIVHRLADRLVALRAARLGERAQGAERALRHLGVGRDGLAQRGEKGGRLGRRGPPGASRRCASAPRRRRGAGRDRPPAWPPSVTTPRSGRVSPSRPAGAPSEKTGTVTTSSRPAPSPASSKRGFRLFATRAACCAACSSSPAASPGSGRRSGPPRGRRRPRPRCPRSRRRRRRGSGAARAPRRPGPGPRAARAPPGRRPALPRRRGGPRASSTRDGSGRPRWWRGGSSSG